MMQPLALVYYEKLMPGGPLANKLRDLNYRVQTVNDPAPFLLRARDERPLLAIVDLAGGDVVCDAIAALKTDDVTGHIPVIAFAVEGATPVMEAAQRADAKLVASETTIANYLPELQNQALQIE